MTSVSDTTTQEGLSANLKEKLGLIAAFICFLIGFWHTGLGLASYNFFGSEYGGFSFAAGVVVLMILAFASAIKGSKTSLLIYLCCAFVTFICNLNYFYPNYRSNELVRAELRDHQTRLIDLKEAVNSTFRDPKLDAQVTKLESMRNQLVDQIKQKGFGPRAEEDLQRIEQELGGNQKITRLKLSRTQADWESDGEKYRKYVDDAITEMLKSNRYAEKLDAIKLANEHEQVLGEKIKKSLDSKVDFKKNPPYVEDLVKAYQETCKKAIAIVGADPKNKDPKQDESAKTVDCAPAYASSNVGIGTFSHTFKSAWKTLSDGGTLTVLAICLFIDFIFPLAIYLLVRRKKTNNNQAGAIWTSGNVEINKPTPKY